jgi:hypothetical protein
MTQSLRLTLQELEAIRARRKLTIREQEQYIAAWNEGVAVEPFERWPTRLPRPYATPAVVDVEPVEHPANDTVQPLPDTTTQSGTAKSCAWCGEREANAHGLCRRCLQGTETEADPRQTRDRPVSLAQTSERRTSSGIQRPEPQQERPSPLTENQWRRWAGVSVAGMLAVRHRGFEAFSVSMAVGNIMRSDKTFGPLRNEDEALCVVVKPGHRDKVGQLLEIEDRTYRDHVARWVQAHMAHRCGDAARGEITLFYEPADVCPRCGTALEPPELRGA